MTTIGLSYSLVKISTKCAPALMGNQVKIFHFPKELIMIVNKLSHENIFDKNSTKYIKNGVYDIAGIRWSTLWAYKIERKYFSNINTPSINASQSLEMSRLGYPSIKTVPDHGPYKTVMAFPICSIEYFFDVNDMN